MTYMCLQHSRSYLHCLAFQFSKLRFRGYYLFDIIDEARGVVGETPEGMDHHILISAKLTLNEMFQCILYHLYTLTLLYNEMFQCILYHLYTLTLLYSLRLQGGGKAIVPNPLNPPLIWISTPKLWCVSQSQLLSPSTYNTRTLNYLAKIAL